MGEKLIRVKNVQTGRTSKMSESALRNVWAARGWVPADERDAETVAGDMAAISAKEDDESAAEVQAAAEAAAAQAGGEVADTDRGDVPRLGGQFRQG